MVAISHVCVPEDGCSSAKVLVTEAGVGPGTLEERLSDKADDLAVSRLTEFPRLRPTICNKGGCCS